ncbi:MAG TPA: hypothetical protein VM734_19655 [Kofleriaceae bacterium]|nr:hypothetical protein [Kofleriaceae bacterium]
MPSLRSATLGTLVLAALATACDDGTAPSCSLGLETRVDTPLPPGRAVDLLIVLDRTPSMDGARQLVDGLARQIDDLLAGLPGPIDLRVAAISSELGATGVAGCGNAILPRMIAPMERCGVADPFLRVIVEPGGAGNLTTSLDEALACWLDVAVSTCPVSQPLLAAVRAFGPGATFADDIRRPDAHLAILIVTDGDDCSLGQAGALATDGTIEGEAAADHACFARGVVCDQPADAPGVHTNCRPTSAGGLIDVASRVQTLRGLGGPLPALIGVVAGDGEVEILSGPALAPACTQGGARFAPAVRLGAITGDATAVAACPADPLDALAPLADRFRQVTGQPCLEPLADLEPGVAGFQGRCRAAIEEGPSVDPVRACDDPARDPDQPCLRFTQAADPACTVPVIEPGRSATASTTATVRCALRCD